MKTITKILLGLYCTSMLFMTGKKHLPTNGVTEDLS